MKKKPELDFDSWNTKNIIEENQWVFEMAGNNTNLTENMKMCIFFFESDLMNLTRALNGQSIWIDLISVWNNQINMRMQSH